MYGLLKVQRRFGETSVSAYYLLHAGFLFGLFSTLNIDTEYSSEYSSLKTELL
jgi:hypothetical protein